MRISMPNSTRKNDTSSCVCQNHDMIFVFELFIFSIIILVTGLYSINKLYGLINGSDDIGYICNAKYMLGSEWKEISGTLAYYSFGYSFILAPLVFFIKDPTLLFRSIVVLNVCMIEGSFLLSCKCISNLYKEVPKRISILICFIASMYISNFAYSKYVFTEAFLVFLFWVITLLLQSILNHFSYIKVVIIAIVSIFMFYVHQRTLALVAALVLMCIIMTLRKEFPKNGLSLLLVLLLLLFLLGNIYKKSIIDNVYLNNMATAVNDFSGQVGKLKYMFTFDGLGNLFLGFLSKIYYLLFATVLIGGIGLIRVARKAFTIFSFKNIDEYNYFYLFMILCFFLNMSIQTYFLIIPERYDLVIYGRYIEYICGFFIVEGILEIYEFSDSMVKRILFLLIILFLGGFSAIILFEKFALKLQTSYLAPAVYMFFDGKFELKEGIYLSILIIAITSLFIVILNKLSYKRKDVKVIIIGVMMFCLWGKSLNLVDNAIISDQDLYNREYVPMADYINGVNSEVVILNEEELSMERVRQLQYLCQKKDFHMISNDKIQEYRDCLFLTEHSTAFSEELKYYGGEIVYTNYKYYLWKLQVDA